MSTQNNKARRNSLRSILKAKGHEPIVCLTAYTAPVARIADKHADLILVGDSLGMVLYGFDSTVQVTLDLMINHGRAVVNSTSKALVVVDMPFGSYQESPELAYRNAARVMKETGAMAVKIEGGTEMAETIAFLCQRGVPVMGHIGLKPQSVHAEGGYRVTGRDVREAESILADALAVEKAGAFAIVLECIDPDLASNVTRKLRIPTIGIGASAACDGQILVTEDMVGMTGNDVPKFVKQYARIADDMERAMKIYAEDVKEGRFPQEEHTYALSENSKKIRILN